MNPRALLAGLALAAAVVVTNIVIRGDETPPEAGDACERERVVALRDGGSGYAAECEQADGGKAVRLLPPACVRRLPDAGVNACRRRLSDGGVTDQGALNRFLADAAVGTRCQPVACVVEAERLPDGGDPANEEETETVVRRRDGGR
jgi:hypothetical protein